MTLEEWKTHGRTVWLSKGSSAFSAGWRIVSAWGPVLLWMAGIYYFSSQPKRLSFVPDSVAGRGFPLNAMAHLAVYAGLALFLYRAVSWRDKGRAVCVSSGGPASLGSAEDSAAENPRRGAIPSFIVLTIALAFAFTDEIHQARVPGRDFDWLDIACDMAGIGAALGLIWARTRLQFRSTK